MCINYDYVSNVVDVTLTYLHTDHYVVFIVEQLSVNWTPLEVAHMTSHVFD